MCECLVVYSVGCLCLTFHQLEKYSTTKSIQGHPTTVFSRMLINAVFWLSGVLLKLFKLPSLSLIRNFGKQNTRGNVSKISFSLACYRHIGSKFTNTAR